MSLFKLTIASCCLFFLGSAAILSGQQAPQPGKIKPVSEPIPEPIPLIRQLFVQDQRDRGVPLANDGNSTLEGAAAKALLDQLKNVNMYERDVARRKQTHILIENGELKTARDFRDAAFIFQHGDSAADYLLAHLLAVESIAKKDDPVSRWIAAATLDRYLQSIGQKQVFGTQFLTEQYAYYLAHPQAPDLDAKMKQLSDKMQQEPYDTTLLPDAFRQDFCVPAYAQQQEDLQAWQKNETPQGHSIPGCGR